MSNLRISDFFNNASGIDIDGGNYNIVTGCLVDDNEVGIHIKNGRLQWQSNWRRLDSG